MEQVMLDMIPTGAKAVCHVSQYDIGRTIRFNLRSGGAPYTLAGTETVKVYIKKPDGTTAERNIANTSSTYVDWVTGEVDCDVAGKCECELIITSGTIVIGSKNFIMNVEEDPYNDQGVVTETAGPAIIATFTTNVVDLLQEVKCSINPIQNGTPWIDSNVINKVPYIKRNVAGTASRIGNHLYDKLVGGTVAWNQLVDNNNLIANKSSISYASGKAIITANGGDGYFEAGLTRTQTGHKYLAWYELSDIHGENLAGIGGSYGHAPQTLSDGLKNSLTEGFKAGVFGGYENRMLYVNATLTQGASTASTDTFSLKNIAIFDLTAMFGSTIADFIYNLEFSTTGAGVAWFKALFSNDYYAYNAGESISVKATAHIMRDASNTVIGNYPLDSNLELRGIPMLVNNKLEYDGDEYTSDGNVLRKYPKYTFTGSENWEFYSSEPAFWHCSPLIINGITGIQNICSNGVPVTVSNGTQIRVYLRNNPQISGTSNLNDIFANGTTIVYAAASPTTETAQPFTNPQVCDENGTEEYTDSRSVAIPVGHETYQANICEITGFDELNVVRTGANIWDEQWEQGGINATTGANNSEADCIRSKNYISVQAGETYYFYVGANWTKTYLRVRYYNIDGSFNQSTTVAKNSAFTVPSGCAYMRFVTPANEVVTTYGNDISINSPSSDHDYHSYSGKLIKLEFDDTVYLAEASCLNGVWKLKLLGAEVDLGDLSWYPGACALENKYTMRSDGIANLVLAPPSSSVIVDILCPIYPTIIGDSTYLGNTGISILRGGTLAVFDDRYSTIDSANAFKSAMSGVKLVYPLATPTEITLDETDQFEALLGVNNIWHDGNGNTEVKYLYNA